MKNLIKLPAIVLGLMLLMTGTTQRVMAQDDDISLQSFYDELSPYGTWIQDPQYGYVWRPDVEQDDFRPYYSNGRWAMTEYGNTWVSNYDWGWAPFHYGRWVYNRYRQWIWIPDTVWGPAWVSWRSGGGYYGWAPMGPSLNININFGIPDNWWVFIPQRNIYYDSFPRYYSRRNVTIIHNTTIINNTYERNRRTYYTGPRADDIRRATRRDVTVYNVNRTSRSGRSEIRGNELNIYNPRSSRADRGSVQAPRSSVRGDANLTRANGSEAGNRMSRTDRGNNGVDRNTNIDRSGGRMDRGSIEERNSAAGRSNRINRGTEGTVNPSRDYNSGNRGEGRTSRENNRSENTSERNPVVMPTRPDRSSSNREGRQDRSQNIPQVQPAPQQMPVQPQREERQQPQRMERQERSQPQRMERQERQQPQAQPQRMERQERQSAPPARSEGSRGSEGGRSSRSGRG